MPQIACAKGFAATIIDTAMRKLFELMVAEFQRELDAIEQRPVCERESATRSDGGRISLKLAGDSAPGERFARSRMYLRSGFRVFTSLLYRH